MKHLKLFFALFAMLALGVGNAWAAEVTFDPASDKTFPKDGVTLSLTDGTLTNGTDYRVYKNQTMTISSANGTITNIALTYKSTSYDGGGWATSYQPNADSWTSPTASGEQARITKIIVTYTPSGGSETPEPDPEPTPDPEPEPDPTPDPGTGGTGTINFNSNAVKINAASVTGNDDLGNTWTITTEGTTSYTANNAYYQVGSGSKPATSITFTTTLPSDVNVTAFSAKFGGFSGTAGNVTLKVDDTSVGTGSLNASNDVTVSNSSQATGKKLTVTVTGIAKGVKVYYISYTYTTSGGGSGETVVLLIPKNGCFEGLLLVQLLALFLQQKDSFSATLQVPPCTRW